MIAIATLSLSLPTMMEKIYPLHTVVHAVVQCTVQ
jgi:hypothetical protein